MEILALGLYLNIAIKLYIFVDYFPIFINESAGDISMLNG